MTFASILNMYIYYLPISSCSFRTGGDKLTDYCLGIKLTNNWITQ